MKPKQQKTKSFSSIRKTKSGFPLLRWEKITNASLFLCIEFKKNDESYTYFSPREIEAIAGKKIPKLPKTKGFVSVANATFPKEKTKK